MGDTSQGNLIPMLQKVQEEFGYIPQEQVNQISKHLKISTSKIYGVATFYAQFRFTKLPKHTIKICLGTACHVRAGEKILAALERELNITCGEATSDYRFGLERVACFGCCALAPVVVIDNKVYSRMTPEKTVSILKRIK
jgi:NADH-quinone oxidoreductase subunit E